MPDTAVPPVNACLHGAAQLRWAGGEPVLLDRKQALLLAYLWIEGPTPRGRLAGLLWPQAPDARARGNLRQRLSVLRQAAGDELVVDQRGVLSLSPQLKVAAPVATSAPLLATFDYDDCEEGTRWLEGQRESQLSHRRTGLLADVRAAVQSGQLDAALGLADQLLALDRESEEAYRTQMEVHYLRGDIAAAIAVWDRCKEMLRKLYGVAPSATTRQLGQTLLSAAAGAAGTTAATPMAIPLTVLRPPRLIARQPLLQTLASAWRSGLTLCVSGEAGLGKSRLLAELASAIGPCAMASARPGDASVPYASLDRLLLVAIDRFEPVLQGDVARQAARVLPRLAALLPGAVPAAVQTDYERRQCLQAVSRLLADCAARGCGAFIFDDLQFADLASVEAVTGMAESGGSAASPGTPRFVFGTRGDELADGSAALLTALERGGGLKRIELEALEQAEVAELIASLALPGFDAPSFAHRLWRQVGGNPAFVLESVKLVLALGGPAAAGSGALPLAPDIVAVIERRVGLLSPQARHLAQLAAIAGESWSVPLAAAALACAPLDLSAPLRELELRQVLYGRQFVHDVIALAVRRTIAQSVAEFMHRFVAEYLLLHGGDAARVAAHWLACGEQRRAGEAYCQAASAAENAARPGEQCQLLDAAADCYERAGAADELFAVLEARLETSRQIGRMATQLAQIERLEALACTDEQQLRALLIRRSWQSAYPREDAADEELDAIARARALGLPGLAFQLAGHAAWRMAIWGKEAQALRTLDSHRPWVMSQGTVKERADFHRLRSGVLGLSDRLQPAIEEATLALAAQRSAGHPERMLITLNNMGLFMHWRGDLNHAKTALLEAIRLRDQLHGPGTDMPDLLLALVLHDLGEYADAERMLVTAVDNLRARLGDARGDVRADLVAAENHLAQLWMTLGQPERSAALLAGDDSDLPPRFRWRRMTLRLRAARDQGPIAAKLRAQAQTMLEIRDSPFNRTMLELEAALALAPERALQVYPRLIEDRVVRERPGLLMHVTARAARAEMALGHLDAAIGQVALVREQLAKCTPLGIERAELWWIIAEVLHAAGDGAGRLDVLQRGAAWLLKTARSQVAEPWRESFQRGNPANRRLLAAALAP